MAWLLATFSSSLMCVVRIIESSSAVATKLAADGVVRAAKQTGNLVQVITGKMTKSRHFTLGCTKLCRALWIR
jgi:hypothetical protein